MQLEGRLILALFPAVLAFSVSTGAETFCVETPVELHDALNSADGNGFDDTIQVVQGIYGGNLVYVSAETTTLRLEGGYLPGCSSRVIDPTNTIIDGGGSEIVLALVSEEAHDFFLEGFTLRNGYRPYSASGAGLFCLTDGDVHLRTNVFEDNNAYAAAGARVVTSSGEIVVHDNAFLRNSNGGGLFSSTNGSVVFTGNVVRDNTTTLEQTAGVSVGGKSTTFVGNRVIGNVGLNILGMPGGAFVGGEWSVVTDNLFTGNRASAAGALKLDTPRGTHLEANVFDANETFGGPTSRGLGGAVWMSCSRLGTTTLTRNTFSNNTASNNGGGAIVLNQCRSVTLTNNTFFRNKANGANASGGAVNLFFATSGFGGDPGPIVVTNNSFVENVAAAEGGGFYSVLFQTAHTLEVFNNVFWGNTAALAHDMSIHNDPDSDSLTHPSAVVANDFDHDDGFFSQRPITIGGTNFDDVNPLFADVLNGDLHLSAASTLIDAGDNGAPALPQIDKDLCPRIVGGTVDMGAYEFGGPIELELMDDTVLTTEVFEACETIFVGPNFAIEGFADVTLLAGDQIVFRNGVSVGANATLTARSVVTP